MIYAILIGLVALTCLAAVYLWRRLVWDTTRSRRARVVGTVIREMVQAHLAMPGTQLGDPHKAAAALITIAANGTGPLRQQLGTDSAGFARSKTESLTADIAAGRELAETTDYAR